MSISRREALAGLMGAASLAGVAQAGHKPVPSLEQAAELEDRSKMTAHEIIRADYLRGWVPYCGMSKLFLEEFDKGMEGVAVKKVTLAERNKLALDGKLTHVQDIASAAVDVDMADGAVTFVAPYDLSRHSWREPFSVSHFADDGAILPIEGKDPVSVLCHVLAGVAANLVTGIKTIMNSVKDPNLCMVWPRDYFHIPSTDVIQVRSIVRLFSYKP